MRGCLASEQAVKLLILCLVFTRSLVAIIKHYPNRLINNLHVLEVNEVGGACGDNGGRSCRKEGRKDGTCAQGEGEEDLTSGGLTLEGYQEGRSEIR